MKTLILIFSVLFTTMSFAQVPASVPANGLVGWWPFNGNANDESGNGNNGTLVNSVSYGSGHNGQANSAIQITGEDASLSSSGGFVRLPGSLSINPSEFSISIWVNETTVYDAGESYIQLGLMQDPSRDIMIHHTFNEITFRAGNATLNMLNASSMVGSWHNYILTYANSVLSVYIDGVLFGSSTNTNSFQLQTDMLALGRHWWSEGSSTRFVGFFDDLAIYNRALIDCEIQNLYSSTNPTNTTSASACNSYTWNGTTYTTSGTYTGTTTNCVTQALNLTITPTPAQPTGLACYQTAAFNTATCSWDVSGEQAVQPTLACYETATFNTTTCSWVISGPQAPQKMSYQAVIRNSNDTLLISTPVGMRISLVQGTPSGTVVFSETQTATTNSNGLVSLQIGMGTVVTGTFACIDWASGPYYVKTETDLTGGANYTIISSNELMSVPYALFSANGPTGVQGPAGPQGPIGLTGANGIYSTPTYTIGLWPELGGYVFRISSDGKHGLVSETIDQGCANYGTLVQDNISNPLNHSIDGAKFMDWRTPTKYEAQEMYLQRNAIGNFLSQWYWTSIALYGGSNYYWQQNFSNIQIWGPDNSGYGDFGNGACPINGLIRSVRSF